MTNTDNFIKDMEDSKKPIVYDDNSRCPKCGSINEHTNKHYEEAWGSYVLSEVETGCTNLDCGHKGDWSYGWYSEEFVSEK